MVLRVLGLKQEQTYGNLKTGVTNPDFHHKMTDGNFGLNDDPVTSSDGSRMTQMARAGACKPSGSVKGKCDLKRVGHFLKGFFDNYEFTEGETNTPNIHEFWGGDNPYLTSFTGWATFDEFQKLLKGLLIENLKFDVSNEWLEQSVDFIYKDETASMINQSTYTVRNVAGAIPIMFYDVTVELFDKDEDELVVGIKNSLSFDGKNNHNQDKTLGLGSRKPQVQALAQKREITVAIGSTLTRDSASTILAIEYGEDGALSPSTCKVYNLGVKVTIQSCGISNEKLTMILPSCTANVDYSMSGSDEIETKFNLVSLGTGEVTLADEETTVKTDCYFKLENNIPVISPDNNWTSSLIEEE